MCTRTASQQGIWAEFWRGVGLIARVQAEPGNWRYGLPLPAASRTWKIPRFATSWICPRALRIRELGASPRITTPAETLSFIRAERADFAAIARAGKLRVGVAHGEPSCSACPQYLLGQLYRKAGATRTGFGVAHQAKVEELGHRLHHESDYLPLEAAGHHRSAYGSTP